MKRFKHTLEECFAGCGLSPSQVYRSHNWKRYYKQARANLVPDANNLQARRMLYEGPLLTGLRANGETPTAELLQRKAASYSPFVIAGIRFLGDALLDAALKCLPESIPEPQYLIREWEDITFPITTQELIRRFGTMNYNQRFDIC